MKLWLLFLLAFHSFCWSMEMEAQHTSKHISKLKYMGGFEEEQRTCLEECLEKIKQTSYGKILIDFLEERSTKTIHIRLSEKHVFKKIEEGKPYGIDLNKDELGKEMKAPCIIGLDERFIPIGSSNVPFFIILGHELLHVKHHIEDPERFNHDSAGFLSRYWPIYDSHYYEGEKPTGDEATQAANRITYLWQDGEEQRTVIGNAENSEPCELTLRVQSFLIPRYAYQDADDNFYEDTEIISDILKLHKIDDIKELSLHNAIFNEETAKISRLNSLKYKSTHKEHYEQKIALESDSKKVNASKLEELRAKAAKRQEEIKAKKLEKK